MEAHRSRPPAGGKQSTWIAFAGVLMIILGFMDALWGIAAIANNEIVVVGGHGVMILNITTWGWIQLILGAIVGITGLGLITGNTAARWAGIALVGINAIVQIVWFSAAPLWALMIIAIDVVIIYQLCVNWERDGSGV
jgi:hypothetical protein